MALRQRTCAARRCLQQLILGSRNLASQPHADSEALHHPDHDLSEEQLEMRRVADEFAREELLPRGAEWDEQHHFPVDVLRHMAQLGFGGMYVSPDFGGELPGRSGGAGVAGQACEPRERAARPERPPYRRR
jgi:hypothetical protein